MRVVSSLLLLCACLVGATWCQAQPALPIRCADLSFEDEVLAGGGLYDGGTAMAQLAEAGLNTVRLRLWHTPGPGRD
ncbi:MAG: hypothetical protein AAFX41_12515, partial [Bacteroidota bacterium]